MFVVHVRSDSDLGRAHVVGRVEHVMSGDDAPFGSLEALLAFIKSHVPNTDSSVEIGTPAETKAAKPRKGESS